jgi:hypothetical protein
VNAQRIPGFNADDVRKMFGEDAKKDAQSLGPEGYINLGDDEDNANSKNGKENSGTTASFKPGTMTDGETNFWDELARQLAELEEKGDS